MKHILILCNGEPPSEQLLENYYTSSDLLIAADGGGNTALAMEVTPDAVIGDLDSFDPSRTGTWEIIHDTDQETNDLEKALKLAQQKNADSITILGATGQRLDHTLKNLSVLKQFDDAFDRIRLVDNFGQTQLLPSSFQTKIAIGTQISLFPLSGSVSGITTSGLKYRLNDEFLENGVRDGSSNEVIGNPVEISHQKGDLLLFSAHQNPL